MTLFIKQISIKPTILYKIWIILVFALSILFFTLNAFPKTEKAFVYFHSSETNINNFKSLKINFDRYLSKFGNYEFQPIKDRTAFENSIDLKNSKVLILSSWHYQILQKKHALSPVLVGSYKGKTTQKRILVTRKNSVQKPHQKNSVASASNENYTQTVLSNMAAQPDLKILTVPKDIDALFAAGFGVCEFALTTEQAFKKLKEINPKLYNTLKIFDSCEESLLLIVAIPGPAQTAGESLCDVIKKMVNSPEGKKNLHMLGLDNWQLISSYNRAMLEQEGEKNVSRVKK